MFLTGIVWKNLRQRKVRSLLTVIGIGVGIGAVVALVSITDGFVKGWKSLLKSRGTDLTVVRVGAEANILMNSLDQKLGDELRKIPQVEWVSESLVDIAPVEDKPSVMIFGYHPGQENMNHLKMLEGRILTTEDREGIILGSVLAKSLGARVGDELEVEREFFQVVGIYESGNVLENGGGIVNLETLQRVMNREGQVTAFSVHLKDVTQLEEVKKIIESQFAGLSALSNQEVTDSNEMIRTAQALSWAVLIIVLLVGAIATMNTMFMSVFERTREIGILRALGWRKSRIITMIIQEAVLLSCGGGVVGIFFGMGMVRMINYIPNIRGLVQPLYTGWLFTEAMLIALLLGILGGVVPAWWGSKLKPVEALRYE